VAVIFVACVADVWGGIELEVVFALGNGQGSVDAWCIEVAD
jgi:hypothetical protein